MDTAVNRELLEKVKFDVLKVSGLAKALMSYSLSEDEKKVVEMILAESKDVLDRLREMTSRLTAATDGLRVIHDALLNNDDTISTIVLCNALEPFLKELYVLENSFAGGLKKEAGEVS